MTFIGFCLLLVAALPCLADEERDTIRRCTARVGEWSTTVRRRPIRGIASARSVPASTEIVQWSPSAGVVAWHLQDTSKKIDLEATRSGDTIRVKGTLGGKDVAREISVDQAPWYQIFGPVIDQLLPGVQGQREFWVVNPDDFAAHKMLARRAGTERIDLRGTAVDAVKIHFSPANALAPFWGADYWFRAGQTRCMSIRGCRKTAVLP